MHQLDLLLVTAPSRKSVYGVLSEISAIEPPVWAALIARHCLDRGFTVAILDAEAEGLDCQQTANRIDNLRPRLAAFCIYGQQPSASTQCLPAASLVAKMVAEQQRVDGWITTLALGTHPSALPERTLREEPFDFICQGEGTATIVPLLTLLRFNADVSLTPTHLMPPGLWLKKKDGTVYGSSALNTTDLDRELPGQAWELLDLKRYRAHNWHLWTGDPAGGYASVQTSLGCPFRCSFCCINTPFGGAGIRYWSPTNMVRQIGDLVDIHHIINIKIPDEMFTLSPARVKDICRRLIAPGYSKQLNMWSYARIDTVKDEEMLALMRAAGFRWLGIGVESGSKHVRDSVDKGRFGDDDIRAAIRRVQGAGIAVAANYIFGLPDDTLESMQATLDLACDLNTEWANFYCAMAYPGSPLHQTAVENGWPLPEGPGGPGWVGYSQHAYEALPLPTYSLTSAQVLDFRDEAFMKYFGRPEYLHMLGGKFGAFTCSNVIEMLSYGKTKRKHREER